MKVATTYEESQLARPNSFWPWGVFSRSRPDLSLGVSRSIGHMPVTLSCGDGVQDEPELLACACLPSLRFLAHAGFRVDALSMCALGCGEALKDCGSGIFAHANEVPCIFASWLSDTFVARIRRWRTCRNHRRKRFARSSIRSLIRRARCPTLKCATLEGFFIQGTKPRRPISFVSWAEIHSMPHVFEPKRPSRSDPENVAMLFFLWLRNSRLWSSNSANVMLFEQRAMPKPRESAAWTAFASSATTE